MQSYQISINPYTTKQNDQIATQTDREIESVLACSQKGFTIWKKTSLEGRTKILLDFADKIKENQELLASLITQEMGCPIAQTLQEVDKVIKIIDYYSTKAPEMLQPTIVEDTSQARKEIHYSPYGTLFHISPYNYPLYLALRPLIPSLLVGNANILKTPSNTPLLALALAKIIAQAGFPDGVFQVVFVGGSDTKQLIADERVNLVTLIGSEKVGSMVGELAGMHLKKVLLELGGSDAMIVCGDGDIPKAVDALMFSRMRNAGQSCNAVKRVLIHTSIKADFTRLLLTKIAELVPGDPQDHATTIGPVATQKSLELALEQINDSVAQGAQILAGGHADDRYGFYLQPTVLDEITVTMPVFAQEVFAPVIALCSFETIDEAISMANNSRYGLGACVWSNDEDSIEQAARELETGNIAINSIVRGDPTLPYGGVKKSGFGREFGEIGLKELVNVQSITRLL